MGWSGTVQESGDIQMPAENMETLVHDSKVVLFSGDVLVNAIIGGAFSAGHETVHAAPRVHEYTAHRFQNIIRLSCACLFGDAVHLVKVFNSQSNHLP